MKLISFLVIFISSLLCGIDARAGHMYGRELTWSCVSSGPDKGKFIFECKYYARCLPQILPTVMSLTNPLYSNWGGPANITLTKVSDLLYDTACASGISGSCTSPDKWVILYETIFQSQPVALYGKPATNGSDFYYTACCRSPYINTKSSGGHYLAATMYPYINPETGNEHFLGKIGLSSCYDNSPKFAESPFLIRCLKMPGTLNYGGTDLEGDSLTFEWIRPRLSASNYMSYEPGYSIKSPLADSAIYSSNKKAILNPNSGRVTFQTDSPAGYFATALKITSYRYGQKLSEVRRDIPVFVTDCQVSTLNTSPEITFKTKNASTYQPTLHIDAYLGDQIEIDLRAIDLGFLAGGFVLQSPDVRISGHQASSIPQNSINCLNPPCAYLDTNNSTSWNGTNVRAQGISIGRFFWEPECNNLIDLSDPDGYSESRTFTFYVLSKDDFCPVPGENANLFTITVRDTNSNSWPIDNIEVQKKNVLLEWPLNASPSFSSYEIYMNDSSTGTWTKLTSIGNASTTSYLYVRPSNYTSPIYFRVQINKDDNCHVQSHFRSSFINSVKEGDKVKLNWHGPYHNVLFAPDGHHAIERKDTTSNWHVINTVPYGQISIHDLQVKYNSWMYYRLRSIDSSGFTSLSNVDSVYFKAIDTSNSITNIRGSGDNILVYPNPIKDEFYVEVNQELSLDIMNVHAKCIKRLVLKKGTNKVQISELEDGLYYLLFISVSGDIHVKRIIKSGFL